MLKKLIVRLILGTLSTALPNNNVGSLFALVTKKKQVSVVSICDRVIRAFLASANFLFSPDDTGASSFTFESSIKIFLAVFLSKFGSICNNQWI